MFVVISGASGSGKSEYAESQAVGLSNKDNTQLVYIATMMAFDEEARAKIKRHRLMRKDKGFATIECFYGLKGVKLNSNCTVLLDCMSNLVANEMFNENGAGQQTVFEVMTGIDNILTQAKNVVIVTNEVFSDGCEYDDTTLRYIAYLGSINKEMAKKADVVTEVVYGIPINYKVNSI